MKLRRLFANAGVIALSASFGLLLCEFASRLFLNPADYLSVEMIQDEILGAIPSPAARAGFDKWGFRNLQVPETADIVTIGDSHTYGNTATMADSWPYVLAGLTGRRVYNMGLGGYGPNQYYHLLDKALSLKPRTILCGLYMGDDFENAFLITYGLDHWANLRRLAPRHADFDIWMTSSSELSWHKRMRVWLSGHSVTYQLVFHGILGAFKGAVQIRHARRFDDLAATLAVPEKNILEAFLPKSILLRLDQNSEAVREGMRITFELLRQMNEICNQNHVEFVVVVIPTKELVFSDYLEHNRTLSLRDVFDSVLVNERVARDKLFRFLTGSAIAHVDALPALKAAAEHRLYARTAADMHPNRNGYRVIATAVFGAMKQKGISTRNPGAASRAFPADSRKIRLHPLSKQRP